MTVAADLRYAAGLDAEEVGGFVRYDYALSSETCTDLGGDGSAASTKKHRYAG